MAPRYVDWTRDELILALDLYFRFPYRNLSKTHPEVIALSQLLNDLPIHPIRPNADDFRNPNGVYMKLGNFLRLDPSYTGIGLQRGAKLDVEVWNEFADDQARLRAVALAIQAVSPLAATQVEPTDAYDDEEEAPEGRILLRQHKVRERKSTLIRKKKALVLQKTGRLACECCRFVFSEHYGELGAGFIECHHTIPVSQLRPGQVTRVRDLALVCANCHRMLHQGSETLTIDALRSLVGHRLSALA